MSASIVPYSQVSNDPKVLQELREIFFESSTKKSFKDEAEKEAFFEKYLGWYLRRYPDYAFLARDKKVLGYVVVSPITMDNELDALQPHLKTFADYIERYPAHLHINCHADSRGQGVGQNLISAAIQALEAHNIQGLHIMTGADSRNRAFYSRLGFDFETQLNFHGSPILFMGKRLSENKF